MNKNLKRALNTTAAVSMSLAMVLGAVAPVTNVSAEAVQDVAHDAYAKGCYKILAAILDDFGGLDAVKGLSYDAVATDLTDAFKGVFAETSSNLENLTGLKVATDTDTVAAKTSIASIAKTVSTYSYDEAEFDTDVIDFAKHLLGVKDYESVKEAADQVHTLYIALNTNDKNFAYWAEDENDIDNDSDYAKAKAAYDAVDKVAAYAGNVAKDNKDDMANFAEDMEIVKEKLDNYVADNNEVYYKDYVEALEDFAVYSDGPTVYQLVERNADIPLNKLAALEKAIKNIKADKAGLSDEIEFDDVAGEEEVAHYIEGLETIVKEMKDAKDLMKTTSEAYKEFKSVKNKLVALADATVANYEEELSKFRAQDVEKVVNYVDEVFSKFFYVKATYRTTSGEYNLTLKDADYGRYVDEEKDFNTAELVALRKILKNNINKESEESLYDMLAEKSVDIEKLYKAVTTDIEGIKLGSVITDKEAAKIVAAHKAMKRLQKGGDLHDSLTPAEKREVEANKELVEALYFKLLYSSDVVETGWVKNADGSWSFLEEDGTVRQYGWVAGNGVWSFVKNGKAAYNDWCAAKEGWYYMGADGYMVSNTTLTIDGISYTFDANGLLVD